MKKIYPAVGNNVFNIYIFSLTIVLLSLFTLQITSKTILSINLENPAIAISASTFDINNALKYITNLYNPHNGLVKENEQIDRYWLWSDNILAAQVLKDQNHTLAAQVLKDQNHTISTNITKTNKN